MKTKRKKGVPPPSTRRYCLVCRNITMFDFKRALNHSQCKGCGCRAAINYKVIPEMYDELLTLRKEVKTLRK